uniref:Uncharacterized protein n=1 Tax=Peronospora matthiolae TaxID=2874970 RepID=A0AAV1UR74_9STRA
MLSKIVAEIAQKVLSQQEETQRQIKTAISLVQQGVGPWSLDLENIKWPTYDYALKHVAGLIEDPVEQAKALGRVDKQVKEYKEFLMPALQDK